MQAIPHSVVIPRSPLLATRDLGEAREMPRALCEAINARLPRILIETPQTQKAQPKPRLQFLSLFSE